MINVTGPANFVLDGTHANWTQYHEEFGNDNYLWGPEYGNVSSGISVPAGTYLIVVSSPNNRGKYVLVTGWKEEFPLNEALHAIIVMPQLKEYFGKSKVAAIESPFIWMPTGVLAFLLLIVIVLQWRKSKRNSPARI